MVCTGAWRRYPYGSGRCAARRGAPRAAVRIRRGVAHHGAPDRPRNCHTDTALGTRQGSALGAEWEPIPALSWSHRSPAQHAPATDLEAPDYRGPGGARDWSRGFRLPGEAANSRHSDGGDHAPIAIIRGSGMKHKPHPVPVECVKVCIEKN